jgi:alpha-methylacyl-CoA racemase
VVDTAMVDGAASQTAFLHGLLGMGAWTDEREANLLDGAAPFYDTYTCSDGRYLAIGAIEPQFFAALCEGLGIDPAEFPQHDQASWPDQKAGSRRSSPPAPATSGRRSSTAPTRASRRCCR